MLSNASRCYAAIVSTLLGCSLPQEIPDHDVCLLNMYFGYSNSPDN